LIVLEVGSGASTHGLRTETDVCACVCVCVCVCVCACVFLSNSPS
jgi:hypothetical protein